jgi:hypothetical protein
LIGARYKENFVYTHINLFQEPVLVIFSLFGPQKTHYWAGRHESKEKCIFYFGLRILLPIQIQLLDIENPKKYTPPSIHQFI